MNLSTTKNINGELIDLRQACEVTNLGVNTMRKLASEAGIKWQKRNLSRTITPA